MRTSSCTHPQANLNEEVTEWMRLSQGKDEDLGTLNMIHKLILPHREESEETTDKSRNKPLKKMEPGTCLGLATGDGGHSCDRRSCLRIRSFQRTDLATWFSDVTETEKKARCR